MPYLDIHTVTIELPSYPGSEVVIYEKAPFDAIADIQQGMTNRQMAEKVLPGIILSWNFTDKEGKELPVTFENLIKLPATDVEYLTNKALEKVQPSLKKKT